ncbi:MAG TPA: 3'-5' exonuclease [Verrucomicrobiae bacterium]|nr:3'-5' exonuclease [Verrucomicrobiae bacterium]
MAATGERRTIPHEELMQLPVVRYHGPIHSVLTEEDLHCAVREIRAERVVGFDTESRPSFRKGKSHAPSLVQIATSRAVHLFQLKRLDCSHALAEVLGSAKTVKAGIALGRDMAELQKLFPFTPANVVDLGDIAKRRGIGQTGLRNLAGLFLGGRITKGPQTSNWARANLSPSQLCYAATDAWACRELYLRFETLGLLAREGAATGPV